MAQGQYGQNQFGGYGQLPGQFQGGRFGGGGGGMSQAGGNSGSQYPAGTFPSNTGNPSPSATPSTSSGTTAPAAPSTSTSTASSPTTTATPSTTAEQLAAAQTNPQPGAWENGLNPSSGLNASGQPNAPASTGYASFQGGGRQLGTQGQGAAGQMQSQQYPAGTFASPPASAPATTPASAPTMTGNTAQTNSGLAAETSSTGVDPTPGADNSFAAVVARLQANNAASAPGAATAAYNAKQQAFTAANSGYGSTGYMGDPTQVAAQVAGGAQSSSIPQGVLDPSFYVGGANYGGGQQLGANGIVGAQNPALTAGPMQLTANHPSGPVAGPAPLAAPAYAPTLPPPLYPPGTFGPAPSAAPASAPAPIKRLGPRTVTAY